MTKRTTSHISWSEVSRLVSELKKDNNRLHLFITIQSLLGLRISDVLNLKWKDLLDNTELVIIENKTKKERHLIVNKDLKNAVLCEYNKKFSNKKNNLIFLNKHKTSSISVSYVNRELKKAFKKYNVDADHVSSHIFRKSFAYKILEDGNFSNEAIFKISRMFMHSSIDITMKYLLLDKKQESDTYLGLQI